jgi:hypothetical protein|tara:strand:- start:63 stop:221 length:159 start_codon:yes stop_codon:yes gene_type:complete
MIFCNECKSNELNLGCNHCRDRKAVEIYKENENLRKENEFLKNELELINEQN